MKKISAVVEKEVVDNKKKHTHTKNKSKWFKEISNLTTLIHISSYNTDKENLDKKMEILIQKIPDASGLVTTIVLNTKIGEVENKVPNHDKDITNPEFNNLTV